MANNLEKRGEKGIAFTKLQIGLQKHRDTMDTKEQIEWLTTLSSVVFLVLPTGVGKSICFACI